MDEEELPFACMASAHSPGRGSAGSGQGCAVAVLSPDSADVDSCGAGLRLEGRAVLSAAQSWAGTTWRRATCAGSTYTQVKLVLRRVGLSSSSTKAFHSQVLLLLRCHLVLSSHSRPGRCSMKEPLPSQ